MEKWNKISSLENFSISSYGNLRNDISGKILKHNILKTGYNQITIKPNGRFGKSKSVRIHREVAIAFIPNPMNLPQVNHIDGNKLNNNVTNLEWVTASQNQQHAVDSGLVIPRQGEDMHSSVLTNEQVRYIIEHPEIKNIQLSKMFNIDRSAISKVRTGKNWSKANIYK